MGALVWFIAAVVLAASELLAGEFTLLMLGGGALITAGLSLTGIPLWAQLLAFGVSTVLLIIFVKPALTRHAGTPLVLDTSANALVGSHGTVTEPFSACGGQIRLDGSVWSARALDPASSFAVGDDVTVVDIDGPTAVVWKEP